MNIIRIGTRESKLAVAQAALVAQAIGQARPDLTVTLVTMKTTGDIILDRTLDKVGGKGLFVKELDAALIRGEVDLCVHSYKDMPAGEDPALPVVAVGPREDPRDVLVLPAGAEALDPAKPVGCSSRRRQVQLGELCPGHPIAPVRGNVLTRLEKLDRGEYAALVLAAAGLRRLGLWDRATRPFAPEEMLPAGCQGMLAVQGRRGEDYSYLSAFHNQDAADAAKGERAFIRRLNGGCGAPMGVFALLEEGQIWLRGMAAGQDGVIHRGQVRGARQDGEALGKKLAEHLLERMGEQWNTVER